LLVFIQAVILFFHTSVMAYFITFFLASVFYFVEVYFLKNTMLSKKAIILISSAFIFLRIIFITIDPIGSDDYYRYLWDGKVSVNGINPYKYSPDSPELDYLHSDNLPDKVSYPNIKTIYFPVSQWLFKVSYLVSRENPIALKLILLLFDILILISLYYLLNHFKIDTKFLLIYLALPLINFQFFIDAHIDLAGAALLLFSLTFYFYNKKILSYILLGLSLSVKPTGLLLLPFYFQNENAIKEKLKSFIIPTIVFVITFLPYLSTGTPLGTLINYSVNWTFNGLIYNTLKLFMSNNAAIRICSGVLFILVYIYMYFIKIDLIRKIYLSLFLLIIFSPIVHPWYLIWFAVLLPFVKSYSGIYFVSVVSVTFLTVITFQTTGIWKESTAVLMIEYIPTIAIFLYEILKIKIFTSYT